MTGTTRSLATAILLATMATARLASAQAPGAQAPRPSSIRSEFMAEILDQANAVMNQWSAAWSNDDLEALADTYSQNAIFLPGEGEPILGRSAIREHLASLIPTHGTIEAFMRDFDAGDGLAMVYGYYRLDVVQERGPARSVTGTLMTILTREGRRDWRIRSQVFRPAG